MANAVASLLQKIMDEDIDQDSSISEDLLLKLCGVVNWIVDNAGDYVGKIEACALTEAQFAVKKNYSALADEWQKKWVLINGQSIAGSKFSADTGINVLPASVANGAHLEQLKPGGSMLGYLANQNKAHTHNIEHQTNNAYGPANGGGFLADGDWHYDSATSSNGGDVARPNSITVNFFLKIND